MLDKNNLPIFKSKLKALLEEFDVCLNVHLEGDTDGLETSFVVENNKSPWLEFTLNAWDGSLSISDFKE